MTEKLCPRCFLTMNEDSALNSISHDGKTEICSVCGEIETMEKFRPDLAEGLKVAQRRAQAAIYGLDEKCNPKIPKGLDQKTEDNKSCWYDHCDEVCTHVNTDRCPLKKVESKSEVEKP